MVSNICKLTSAAFMAAAALSAGEYSPLSVGIQVDVANAATKFVPFQSEAGNIQGAEVATLLGFAVTSQVRFGPIFTERLSAFVLTPTLAYRFGSKSDDLFSANLNFYTANGSIISVQNAQSERKTATKTLAAIVPLRWYAGGNAVYGGLYFEGGYVWARQEQDVDLKVEGLIQAQQSEINESSTIKTDQSGFVAGIGYTWVYRASQATVGLQYQSLQASGGLDARGETRLVVQWTF